MSDDDDLDFLLQETEATLAESNGDGTGATGRFYEAAEEIPEPEPEPVLEDEPIKIGDGECKVCGEPTFRPPGLTKTGRLKRPPVYCDLHNPKIKVRPDFVGAPDLEAQLRRVQGQLSEDVMLFGMGLGTFLPVTGYYVISNADLFTTAVLQLAKNNPRMMRTAHRLAQISPVYQVFRYGAGVATSYQVDQKKTDPYSRVAQHLGVSDAYSAVYSNTSSNSSPSNGANSSPNTGWNGPPKYATVQ